MKERNQYFDFLRGVAIIMVVGIHTSGHHCGFDSLIAQLNTILRQLLNAGVPLFFAISGFFLSRKDLSTGEKNVKFWKHQIPKVYVPALIWGIPWLALGLYEGKEPLFQLLLWLCCGLSYLYFIAVTVQNYFLLPIIKKITRHRRNSIAVILSFASVIVITWIKAFKGVNLPLIVYAGCFPLWILFFVMGVSLSQSKRSYNIGMLFFIVIVTVIAQFYESEFIESVGGAGYGIKPTSFLYSALLILLLFSNKLESKFTKFNGNKRSVKFITWLGNISFGIYLTHYLVFYPLNMLPYNHIWFVDWILTLSFDILFVLLLRKIFPVNLHKYLAL